jgi:hypothetical protein
MEAESHPEDDSAVVAATNAVEAEADKSQDEEEGHNASIAGRKSRNESPASVEVVPALSELDIGVSSEVIHQIQQEAEAAAEREAEEEEEVAAESEGEAEDIDEDGEVGESGHSLASTSLSTLNDGESTSPEDAIRKQEMFARALAVFDANYEGRPGKASPDGFGEDYPITYREIVEDEDEELTRTEERTLKLQKQAKEEVTRQKLEAIHARLEQERLMRGGWMADIALRQELEGMQKRSQELEASRRKLEQQLQAMMLESQQEEALRVLGPMLSQQEIEMQEEERLWAEREVLMQQKNWEQLEVLAQETGNQAILQQSLDAAFQAHQELLQRMQQGTSAPNSRIQSRGSDHQSFNL